MWYLFPDVTLGNKLTRGQAFDRIRACFLELIYKDSTARVSVLGVLARAAVSWIEGRLERLTKVRVKPDEPFEKALRRFKKKCNKEGIMQRVKEMKHYEKPSEKRRRKLAKAIARNATSTTEG